VFALSGFMDVCWLGGNAGFGCFVLGSAVFVFFLSSGVYRDMLAVTVCHSSETTAEGGFGYDDTTGFTVGRGIEVFLFGGDLG